MYHLVPPCTVQVQGSTYQYIPVCTAIGIFYVGTYCQWYINIINRRSRGARRGPPVRSLVIIAIFVLIIMIINIIITNLVLLLHHCCSPFPSRGGDLHFQVEVSRTALYQVRYVLARTRLVLYGTYWLVLYCLVPGVQDSRWTAPSVVESLSFFKLHCAPSPACSPGAPGGRSGPGRPPSGGLVRSDSGKNSVNLVILDLLTRSLVLSKWAGALSVVKSHFKRTTCSETREISTL